MMTYYLTENQINWISKNIKGYSDIVKEKLDFVHVMDNQGEIWGKQIQLHVGTDTRIIHYDISQYGIQSKIYCTNKDFLEIMMLLNSIQNFNSPTLNEGDKEFDRLKNFILKVR